MSGDEPTVNLRDGEPSTAETRTALTVPESGEVAALPAGSIGRFVVQGMLGEGGMGVVLSAQDPELDRKVAIKLLRPDAVGKDGRVRLVREARAMAKLSHPNVVAVYDVGDLGAQPFVAMELIDGEDLRSWLRKAPRGWREILAMFVAAGRGLEAAHAAGIVHRDVKPGNILVGRDGRARIGDFGLVGIEEGTIAGTPAYMAPEQSRGDAVDARSDQYALCVALDEALAGKGAPGWVTTAVTRGRSKDPAQRFPTMTELLAALGRDPAPRRRAVLAIGGALAIGGTLVFALTRGGGHAANPCAGTDAGLAGVWDPARQEAIHAAFVATGAPFAEEVWGHVRTVLDGFTAQWVDMSRDACRATRVAGRQSDTMMDARMQCLDEQLGDLRALGDAWIAGVDAQGVNRAEAAASHLGPLSSCADTERLGDHTPLPTDQAQRAAIDDATVRLRAIHADFLLGHSRHAQQAALDLRATVDQIGWPELQASLLLLLGEIHASLEDPRAEDAFTDAVRYANQAHDDQLAAKALVEVIGVIPGDAHGIERALMAVQLADGALSRAGNPPDLRADLALTRALAEDRAARWDDAERDAIAARTLETDARGADSDEAIGTIGILANVALGRADAALGMILVSLDAVTSMARKGFVHPDTADALTNLGLALERGGDYHGAERAYRSALALDVTCYGDGSAAYAETLNNLGNVEYELGDVDGAARDLRRTVDIREKVLDAGDPKLADALSNLANMLELQGQHEDARAMQERALSIRIRAFGERSPEVANSLFNLGAILEDQGDEAGALADTRRALEIDMEAYGPDHPETLALEGRLGELEYNSGLYQDARAHLTTAATGLAKVAPGTLDHGAALGDLGDAELRLHDATHAVLHLQQSIDIDVANGGGPTVVAQMRATLVRALWEAGRHADALAQEKLAEAALIEVGDEGADELRMLRAWRAKH